MTNFEAPLPLVDRRLADVVSEDARAATVLDRFGLDYCCHGEQTLAESARQRDVPLSEVVGALEALGTTTAADEPPAHLLDLDALVAHVVTRHHAYVRETIPALTAWLEKLVGHHGARHTALGDVQKTFLALADDLLTHMAKEENVLFPFIRAMAVAARQGEGLPPSPFGTILHPVKVMNRDHRVAGELLERLRRLTDGYVPPADACRTYQLCVAELARFDADLRRHVHLEDHVLFPRALTLEAALT